MRFLASRCNVGGVLYNNRCFHFISDVQKNFNDAAAMCEKRGGSLAIIRRQEESDFLSEALFSLFCKIFTMKTNPPFVNHWFFLKLALMKSIGISEGSVPTTDGSGKPDIQWNLHRFLNGDHVRLKLVNKLCVNELNK